MYDCEAPSCYTEAHPIARKRHRCCECCGWIEPGERYQRITGVWDHRGETFKTCSDCEAMRKEADANAAHAEDLMCYGRLCDWASRPEERRSRYVAIMQKRGAEIHPSWLRKQA